MKIGIAALTDTQRVVLASGKALAEELGLHPFVQPTKEVRIPEGDKALLASFGLTEDSYQIPSNEAIFTEGQTVLVASPQGINVGSIAIEVRDYFGKQRYTEYSLNEEVLFKKHEHLKDGEWVEGFSADLQIPDHGVLYVS